MPASELAQLTAAAEQLSPERSPAEAVELNQQLLHLDPTNAVAHEPFNRSSNSDMTASFRVSLSSGSFPRKLTRS